MVTRVDKKPIIYNTTFIRVVKPSIVCDRKSTLDNFLKLAKGHRIPEIYSRDVLDDYGDIEYGFRLFGIDDPALSMFGHNDDTVDDEAIRIARMCLDKSKSMKQIMRSKSLMEDICTVQNAILNKVDSIYYGTEAVYQVFDRALWGTVFENVEKPNYAQWCNETTKKIIMTQSTYNLLHPTASRIMTEVMGADMTYPIWYAWDTFKKLETLALRISSRKNILAHAFYAGVNKKGFEPSKTIEEDFLLPTTGYCQTKESVEVYMIMGLRYVKVGSMLCILSPDDCVNLATMAQCYFRTALYFTKANNYSSGHIRRATDLVRDMSAHCCRLIEGGKNFANFIRSVHILAQGLFNDLYEKEMGTDLNWEVRSKNYIEEAYQLDPRGMDFHNRAISLADDEIDMLNTCFIYHVFVGDEMQLSDMRTKVSEMKTKVLDADTVAWNDFLNFVKQYTLSRFMMVNKKRPKVDGDISLLNAPWANRCVAGMFTMAPHSEWGKVWIANEFKYTDYADVWHLEAQDVAYVVKDSDGLISGKYVSDRKIHSELLMAMTHGNVLDIKTKSTPDSARKRICSATPVSEVVLTCAPKAENAKPSWKKRVTFAADCEFRKMQAEYDKNCRRIMSFIRGPSLGVDQCILEKQFADIAEATTTGLAGAICSHDISAWSESMDRDRKFEFEKILIDMFDKPDMINIKEDWAKINAVVNKQGCKDVYRIDNGSFQGFDGSASTLLHSFILLYCIDTARRKNIMPSNVKTNMATLIDDCIALMLDLFRVPEANAFWEHLKVTYRQLGFEVDELKSVFSSIKAIYLSRRFLLGGEVPSDFKVFIKAHSSYEDPLRCTLDIPKDIFGAMRGACDANGDTWYIYYCACLSVLAELAHNHNEILDIPPSAAAIFALAPVVENGWGFPTCIDWCTNDITDKRSHFNALLELLAIHDNTSEFFKQNIDVWPKPVAKAVMAIKNQAWRQVSYSNIFTNPFEAIRDGPLKPDMLRRVAIQELLEEVAIAEPWKSLLKWNTSNTTVRIREMLISSGPLHAPTLSALVNCMPDNYRLSLIGKAMGSDSLLSLLPRAAKLILKRRVHKCSASYFKYSKAIYSSTNVPYESGDFMCMTYTERSIMEREEFYTANGVVMTDHTFPDPAATFTVCAEMTGSVISPNMQSIRIWDKTKLGYVNCKNLIANKGMYVPRRSGRVWEVTCEYGRGWDSVSQRIAMGLAVLARAETDGHRTEGLLTYFIKSWNEASNITPKDTHLIAIHGSIKRLDANPGSATHPITCSRNTLKGFNNKIKTACDAIPGECERISGVKGHLHDFLAHETAMLALTSLIFQTYQRIGVSDHSLKYNISARRHCMIPENPARMRTNTVMDMINLEILDSAEPYGLLQACPTLAVEIAIPTMKASWVKMINGLISRDVKLVEDLRMEAYNTPLEELLALLESDEVYYSPAIILAAEPATRAAIPVVPEEVKRLVLTPIPMSSRVMGDDYIRSVRSEGSRFSRALSESQPNHIIAATCIRSLVWSRVRKGDITALSKILFQDPDADYEPIKRCGTTDFWRGAIVEVARVKGTKVLSEVTMSALRSLGVHGLHLTHNEDVKDVTQAVASYFGAHLRACVVIISDLVCKISGRRMKDYEKPLVERMITNNPALFNAKLRKEHITKLIESTIKTYKERIEALESGNITHRGDKRIEYKHGRVVDLRCRVYIYTSAIVEDSGQAIIDEKKYADYIINAAKRVCERLNIEIDKLPIEPTNIEGALTYMEQVDDLFKLENLRSNAGWEPEYGNMGTRLAYQTLQMDANMVMNTIFAITAAEVAPKIHKKVILTAASEPISAPVAAVEPLMPLSKFLGDDEGDAWDFMAFAEAGDSIMAGPSKPPIECWKCLYSLLFSGNYQGNEVNQQLGTQIPDIITPSALREAHLEDFSDDDILACYPSIAGDYLVAGVSFDPEWLERDEADAYTTDEIGKLPGGFLF